MLDNGILYSNKKEGTSAPCSNDGIQKHSFEQKKPCTKEYTVSDSTYMKFKNKQY